MRISQVGGKIRRGDAHPPPIAECNSSASALQSTKKIVDSSAVVSRMTDEFKIAEISAPENKNSNLEKITYLPVTTYLKILIFDFCQRLINDHAREVRRPPQRTISPHNRFRLVVDKLSCD